MCVVRFSFPRFTFQAMRKDAAGEIQFDYLLTLTKPILPLLMLLTTGQVYNGLVASMATGYVLRVSALAATSET
jgi:hypothetical protein